MLSLSLCRSHYEGLPEIPWLRLRNADSFILSRTDAKNFYLTGQVAFPARNAAVSVGPVLHPKKAFAHLFAHLPQGLGQLEYKTRQKSCCLTASRLRYSLSIHDNLSPLYTVGQPHHNCPLTRCSAFSLRVISQDVQRTEYTDYTLIVPSLRIGFLCEYPTTWSGWKSMTGYV